MKLISTLLLSIAVTFSASVSAHDAELALVADGLGSWFANFDSRTIDWQNPNPILDNDPDVITFSGLKAGTYTISLIGMEGGSAKDPISFSAITLGNATVDIGKRIFSLDDVTTASPIKLTLTGTLAKPDAYYNGTIQVAAVPEPESYAMFLAGLGLIGGIARRRKAL